MTGNCRNMHQPLLLPLFLGLLLYPTVATAQTISFASLLEEMTRYEANASLPAPAYTCRQASSYDRDANDPEDPSTWYANWDRSHFVRIEERRAGGPEYVLMDEQGPGAVVRFWGTWHGPQGAEFSNGTLRVYLDGNAEPVIEGPIRDILSGGALVGAPLANFVSKTCPEGNRAHNLYLPIPYAKQCKITYQTDVPVDPGARRGEALYYQINFRTYEAGTEVESFSPDVLERDAALVEKTQQQLISPPQVGDKLVANDLAGSLASGEARELTLDGSGAIRQLELRVEADDRPQALRSTVLEIEFDGERTVWCPVGDFFGTGTGIHPFETWYTSAQEDGTLTARWVMPFARSATVRLHNLGEQPVQIARAEVRTSDWQWTDSSLHFHATWRQYSKYKTQTANMSGQGGPRDANYISIDGQGIFVGDTLTLFDAASAWWGEGDEKIYVDGETFPSHFGTGTEDYYGYAWCRGEFFTSPFHAQPIGSGNLGIGPTVNSRYRMLDGIPFNESLRFDMEIWSWANTTINYAPATFWYARPGAASNVDPLPESAREKVIREAEELVPVFRVEGAIEGESLSISRRTGGTTEVQDVAEFGWSGNQQLWWRDAEVGDELDFEFKVAAAGRYALQANLTGAVDYAEVQLLVDGQAVSQPIDRYADNVLHDVVDLGVHDFDDGEHLLTVRIVGANEQAIKRYMFGLDYLLLKAAKEE